jgi:hypothetical protein
VGTVALGVAAAAAAVVTLAKQVLQMLHRVGWHTRTSTQPTGSVATARKPLEVLFGSLLAHCLSPSSVGWSNTSLAESNSARSRAPMRGVSCAPPDSPVGVMVSLGAISDRSHQTGPPWHSCHPALAAAPAFRRFLRQISPAEGDEATGRARRRFSVRQSSLVASECSRERCPRLRLVLRGVMEASTPQLLPAPPAKSTRAAGTAHVWRLLLCARHRRG